MITVAKRQFNYVLGDIKSDSFQFIFGAVQVIVALLLLCYIIQYIFIYDYTLTKLKNLVNQGELYHFRINAEPNQFGAVANDNEKTQVFEDFVNDIIHLPVNKYIANRSMNIFFGVQSSPFGRKGDKFGDFRYFDVIGVTPNFFDVFQIKCGSYHVRLTKAFREYRPGEIVPTVLGADYKRYINQGDTFMDNQGVEYRVIDFIDRDEFYVAPYEMDEAYTLNDGIIIPITSLPINFGTLESICLITDDTSMLDKIVFESTALDLLPLGYESFSEQIVTSKKDMQNGIITVSSIMLLIFIFASIIIIAYYVRFISSRMREFSIHMIYGAHEGSILLRISMQIIFILIMSVVVAVIIFGTVLPVFLMSLIGILYCGIILIYPVTVMHKMSIVGIMRGNAK
jgi:hypothetical protein